MKVIWKKVKYPRIDLRNGEVVVIAPPGTDVNALIESKRDWIDRNLKKVAKLRDLALEDVEKNGVPILDRRRRILRSCSKTGIYDDKIYICKKRSDYLKEKLRILLREDINTRVSKYSKMVGKMPNGVYIRVQSTKWGSCSSLGNLSFNLALIFLTEDFRDYVVAHEILHLIYPNHGAEFKTHLEKMKVKIPKNEETLANWYYAAVCMEKLKIT